MTDFQSVMLNILTIQMVRTSLETARLLLATFPKTVAHERFILQTSTITLT